MDFVPVLADFASNTGARTFWAVIEPQIEHVDGFAFYGHPTLGSPATNGPDFVILAKGFHPTVVRIVPWSLDEISSIGDEEWHLEHDVVDSPFRRLEDDVTALRHRFEKTRALRGKISPKGILCFSSIRDSDFRRRFPHFDTSSIEDFDIIWGKIGDASLSNSGVVNEEHWLLAKSVLQSAIVLNRGASPTTKKVTTPKMGDAIRELEKQLAILDAEQMRAALQMTPGPQCIRGLAGTGKTVLLAIKAATIHAHYPEKKILFTFHTQSLYNQIKNLISRFYRLDRDADPDWDVLHIKHSWGGRRRGGVYYDTCQKVGITPLDLNAAKAIEPIAPFRACCQDLLKHNVAAEYDYILVDEGQDLHYTGFFRILLRLSREPHAIYFAYDEMQNLTQLKVPPLDKFFGVKKIDGSPVVSLQGQYPGPMDKVVILQKSYRCPREVLMLAHALGLGIHGPRGPIQILEDRSSWEAIGYELKAGQMENGQNVDLYRPIENSPNPLSQIYTGGESFISVHSFASRNDEIEWLGTSIARLVLDEGVRPEDIIVTFFDPLTARRVLQALQLKLFQSEILSVVPGVLDDQADFISKGKVTLTTPFRAKGNEAPVVFLFGCEDLHTFAREVEFRNRMFTCISRAKGWVKVSGAGTRMKSVEEEIKKIQGDFPSFKFTFPDVNAIPVLDNQESSRRQASVAQARDSANRLLDVDERALSDLSPDAIAKLMDRLEKAKGEQ